MTGQAGGSSREVPARETTAPGACDYVDADLRDTSAILRAARATLDFGQPVALMLLIAFGPGLIILGQA